MTITKKNKEEESLQERLIEEILKDASKELIKKETLPREEDCDYEPSKKFKKSMKGLVAGKLYNSRKRSCKRYDRRYGRFRYSYECRSF